MCILPLNLHIQAFGEDVIEDVVRHEEVPVYNFVAGDDDLYVGNIEQITYVGLRAGDYVLKFFLHYFHATLRHL